MSASTGADFPMIPHVVVPIITLIGPATVDTEGMAQMNAPRRGAPYSGVSRRGTVEYSSHISGCTGGRAEYTSVRCIAQCGLHVLQGSARRFRSSVGEVPARHTRHCPATSRDVLRAGRTGTPGLRVCSMWLRRCSLTVRGAKAQTSGEGPACCERVSDDRQEVLEH